MMAGFESTRLREGFRLGRRMGEATAVGAGPTLVCVVIGDVTCGDVDVDVERLVEDVLLVDELACELPLRTCNTSRRREAVCEVRQ